MTEKPVTLGDLTRRRERVATWSYVREIQDQFDLSRELAERIADFVVAEIEEAGGESAQLFFTEEGMGPYCSWCGALAGLCPHIAGKGGEVEPA